MLRLKLIHKCKKGPQISFTQILSGRTDVGERISQWESPKPWYERRIHMNIRLHAAIHKTISILWLWYDSESDLAKTTQKT